jgi:hypothetical protein
MKSHAQWLKDAEAKKAIGVKIQTQALQPFTHLIRDEVFCFLCAFF